MSAALDRIHQLLDEAKAALEHMFGHGESAAAQKIDEVKAAIEKDAPALLAEAGTDAAVVARIAETQGVTPAVKEAEQDAGHLAAEAGHDAEATVADAEAPAEVAHTPAQSAAVLAGEAAVADPGYTA